MERKNDRRKEREKNKWGKKEEVGDEREKKVIETSYSNGRPLLFRA